MNKILPSFLLIFLSSFLYGQVGSVRGIVLDKNANEAIIGATTYLKSSNFSKGKAANDKGLFRFDSVPFGSYKLEISSIGFKKVERSIVIDKAIVLVGKIEMEEAVTELKSHKVEDKIPLAVTKGDTTEYNSSAYKTNKDATSGDLVEKMPGITVKNGEVNAQGEKVKQVLVDGKPFFGENPKSTLSNIPATVVQKIQVFDDESDESKATGFKDGNTVKTINIITKPEYRNSKFGNVYAGYGTDKRYNAGGNYNFFNGDQRVSIVGLFNNVNQQNFSSEDLVGVATGSGKRGYRGRGNIRQSTGSFLVPQQNGISKTSAGGINFQDTWGKKKKTDVIASYFYNNSKTDAVENKLQTYFSKAEDNQIYSELDSSFTENSNRKMSLQIKHKFNKKNELTLRSNFSLQDNFGESFTDGSTAFGSATITDLKRMYQSNLLGYNTDARLFFNHRFDKRGRSFFIMARNSMNGNDGISKLDYEEVNTLSADDTVDQNSQLLTKTISYSGKIRFTEPLSKKGGLMFDADFSKTNGRTNNKTFELPSILSSSFVLAPEFSSEFESDNFTQEYSLGYRFFSKKVFSFIRAKYQVTDLKTSTVFPFTDATSNVFQNILPFAMFKYNITKSRYFFVMYRTSTDAPSVTQLQNYLDNSNPVQLQTGNSNLKQNYSHRLMARYIDNNTEKSTTFFAMASYTHYNNYIGTTSDLYRNDTVIRGVNLESGEILNSYENLKGYKSFRAFASYGLPVTKIRSNLNLDANFNLTTTPSLVNSVLNMSNAFEYELGAVLSSNISENVDFTISGRATINDIKNEGRGGNSTFLTQNYNAKAVITFPSDIIFRTSFNYQLNTGFSDALSVDFIMLNASIAKKIFKSKKGEISFGVFDALDQNNRLEVSANQTFVEQLQSKSLQRYALLTFRYTFSKFKKQKEDPMSIFYKRHGRKRH